MNTRCTGRCLFLHALPALAVLCLILACCMPVIAADTAEGVLPAARHIDIRIANNPDGNYIKFDGGGLNALHVSTSTREPYGQVTTSTDQSGTFYFSDTGGRGFFDDLILMVAVNGEVPDNFRIHVRSSGYRWKPTGELNQPPALSDLTYIAGAVDETFSKNQLIYGPQTWKPAGENSPMAYPIFYGQDTGDPATRATFMFIDLKVGALGPNSGLAGLTDNGFAKIEYSVENLGTYATFNAYGWCNQSNQGKGITWSNQLQGEGSSGYTVLGTPYVSHRSEFGAPSGTAPPHVNQRNPINISGSGSGTPSPSAPPVPVTTQKSPAGALAVPAALCLLLCARRWV